LYGIAINEFTFAFGLSVNAIPTHSSRVLLKSLNLLILGLAVLRSNK
jgi:hypothetical protein